MKILVLNCGSSSVKYQLFDMQREEVMARGLVERIGITGSMLTHRPAGREKLVRETEIPDHKVAIRLCLEALTDSQWGVIKDYKEISAVGHRIV
ncbi:MAG: acetate kinase, partial [Moorella sp. (in: firmicutes)]